MSAPLCNGHIKGGVHHHASRFFREGKPVRLWSLMQAATGAPDEEIVLGILEVPSSQAMEMGKLMPDVASI